MAKQDKPLGSVSAIETYSIPSELPIVVSSEVVIYPLMAAPLLLEDEGGAKAIEAAVEAGHKVVAIFGQLATAEPVDKEIQQEHLYPVGTAMYVARAARTSDGRLQVLAQGMGRVGLEDILQSNPFPIARVKKLQTVVKNGVELEALGRNVFGQFKKAVALAPNVPKEIIGALDALPDMDYKADFIASQLNVGFEDQQKVLGELDLFRRLQTINQFLNYEVEILEMRQKIHSEAAGSMEDAQREYFLRQQLKAIQDELGDGFDVDDDVEELREKIESAGLPDEAKKEADRELKRMARMSEASPEYSVSRTYLDWMAELPWQKKTVDRLVVKKAERILDADHYGLEKPKDRILEYLSVQNLKKDMRGPILLLAGPPGTGKTSLGRSVARALGREFVRMSLGGIRDESEIRGHRRTYVGSLPGRIIQGLRRAGTKNPVMMLDEIDKLGADFRGDPSAALLEVLDPEQNNSFVDHYLDVPFDLSEVLFVATANSLHTIPPALMDRMEVLEVSGYTEAEKLEIARKYLVKRQVSEHGLTAKKLSFDKAAILEIIQYYTREAGLRNLEREIGTVTRKVARKFAQGRRRKVRVQQKDVAEYLGARRHRHEVAEEEHEVGVAAGLAWTPVGGDVLFVEASVLPGKGGLKLTGQVGDVMKESAQAAMTYVRSRWDSLGLDENFNEKKEVHIHVPAGAVPKDGPSAGITMTTVLASVFTNRPIRKDVAMTGEVTLRGKVMPIGGVRDKVLAAHRAGVKTVILPEDNRNDVSEIPDSVRKGLRLVFVSH
ncbi:MAG: endopeptidase La, partial [Candidatus Latescibacteria bacterium]|nr:endopeptidase La [Candidatus Latescibacterota bacterium]